MPPTFLVFAAVLSLSGSNVPAQNVTTYKYDNRMSGVNSNEIILTPDNVNIASFGQLFSCEIDGQAYAQPLYLSNVTIPDKGVHNVVYVATCHDSVFAFDADKEGKPLWHDSFISPSAGKGISPVPQPDVLADDISPEVGIVGTPVIDTSTGTLYVVAKTKETGRGDKHNHYVQRLHALDVASGAEKFGGPKVIGDVTCDDTEKWWNATYDYNLAANPKTPGVKGTSPDAVDGVVYFNALRANQRCSLTLANGVVYIAWASHGDNHPYHGWVIGYNATTLEVVPNGVFCVTPDGEEGGVWQSGCGPAVDGSGNIYFSTANGEFTGDKGGRNWSQSFLKFVLSSGLSTTKADAPGQTFDYFTPHNEEALSKGDLDIGCGGLMLFDAPEGVVSHFAIGSGKSGVFYLLNRDNLGHFDPQKDHVIQEFEPSDRHFVMSTPVFFNNTLFYNRSGEALRTRPLVDGQFASEYNRTIDAFNSRGGGPVISAHDNTNGIVWMLDNSMPASLQAYSADALAKSPSGKKIPELYKGRMPDGGVKFTHPIIINGKVYAVCASKKDNAISSAHLCIFGLLLDNSAATTRPAAPTDLHASSNSPEVVTLNWANHDHKASGFIIKRSMGDSTDFIQIDTAGASARSYIDKTVIASTTYSYVVCAVNGKGTSDNSKPVKIESHAYFKANGLVAYWALDESTGSTAMDLTGNGHKGTLMGETAWSQGIQDSASVEFHGTGNAVSHIEVNDQADLDFSSAQSFSIVAWAHVASLPNHWAGVVVKSREQPSGWYGIYINPNNQWTFRGSDETKNISGGLVRPDTWQQIVAVQDGAAGTRALYVDGVQATKVKTTQDGSGTGPLWIGQGNADVEGFAGSIDEVRIYNRALSARDIQELSVSHSIHE